MLLKICFMDEVKKFLSENGFELYPKEVSVYTNGKCMVRIHRVHYEIFSRDWPDTDEPGYVFSRDLNFYWLVGALTWYGLIDKDYVGGLRFEQQG